MSTHTTISHEIAEALCDEILRSRYRSGDRLPSERDLAARFDASRGAVREALSQIEQIGLIDIQPGGARVQAIDAASIAVLGPLMAMGEVPDAALVDQFLQTFGALASLNAREALAKANEGQLNRLREIIVNLSKLPKDFESQQPRWRELLEYLGELADNLVVRLISNDLKAQFVEQMMKLGIRPELKKQTLDQTISALKASIAKRDGDLAAAAIQAHFDELRIAASEAIKLKVAGFRKQAV